MNRLLIIFVTFISLPLSANVQVTKNNIDQKLYRSVVLDNGLNVLLISDEKADRAAAALDVHVGSGTDPQEWEGLAHFLEHMLFLGTKKYPDAGEYQNFIKSQGGSHNAYTSLDHTNYFFSVNADQLRPTLDRFSRFFIDPLFNETYVDRERAVVHSEYQARMKDEGRRVWDAGKSLIHPNHPAAGFSVGSLHTLRDRDGVSVRDKLVEFYDTHYSASIMTLVVLGKEPLDQLETWVSERFSQIANKKNTVPVFTQPYFNPDLMPARLSVLPEKDQNNMVFQFPILSTWEEYDAKPLSYIGNLLGHEGSGSLLAQLKELGWADGLSAGGGYQDTVNGVFSVSIKLTRDGLSNIPQIGALLFETIALIEQQGVEQWRFEEEQSLAQIAFQFSGEVDAGRLVQSLAARMHRYPVDDVLTGPYLMKEFKPESIKKILSFLSPENVNITIISKELESDFTDRTAFYDVAYRIEGIDDEWTEMWSESRVLSDRREKSLMLPEPNHFIPNRLEPQELGNKTDTPERLNGQDKLSIWYRADTDFTLPKASFYFSVKSQLANDNPRNSVMLDIMMALLNDQLSASIYPAYLAGLGYSLYRHPHGFSVRINGFEDKQSLLLDEIVAAIANPDYDESRFSLIQADLARKWNNVTFDSPSNQTMREMYRLLISPSWSETEKLAVLNTITLADLKTYFASFFTEVDVNVLSHGDVAIDKTIERSEILKTLFVNSGVVDKFERAQPRVLADGISHLRTMDVKHNDSALMVYFQGEDTSLDQRAKMMMLGQLFESPFYTNLRTINQVGYLVHGGSMPIMELPGLLMSAQSPSHSPSEIDALMTAFIEGFEQELALMPQEAYEQTMGGLTARILSRDKKLDTRSGRYWREIDLGKLEFDSREKLVAQIESLTLDDIRVFFRDIVIETPRKLTVQSLGQGYLGENGLINEEGYKKTGDITAFRTN